MVYAGNMTVLVGKNKERPYSVASLAVALRRSKYVTMCGLKMHSTNDKRLLALAGAHSEFPVMSSLEMGLLLLLLPCVTPVGFRLRRSKWELPGVEVPGVVGVPADPAGSPAVPRTLTARRGRWRPGVGSARGPLL